MPFSYFRALVFLFLLFLCTTLSAQQKPTFSQSPGYYSQGFSLQLSAQNADAIYYTLNGDEPDSTSLKYTSPIQISDRTGQNPSYSLISTISHSYSPWVTPTGPIQLFTVVRTRSKKGNSWSDISSGSFIVHPKGHDRYSIPVISIITDSLHLFDYETGIYVLGKTFDDWRAQNPNENEGLSTPANYTQRGSDWERPAHFELFDENGEQDVSMDIGIRIHGGGSRSFQQKTFRIYTRSEYGNSSFDYPFFLDQPLREYKRLQLRNSGQDWMKTALRDGFMQSLVRHLPFETMAFRQSVLFVNGEFWGIANIRERYDDDYLAIKYDISKSKIHYLSGNASVEEGTADHYNAMLDYISANGLTDSTHYNYIKTQMDIESFTSYYLSNIYFNNRDWPHNNIDYWRYDTPYNPDAEAGLDGRWRWMMFDTDFGFAWTDIHTETKYQGHVQQNLLAHVIRDDHWSTFLMNELLKNEAYKEYFVNSYRDLMNSSLRKERVVTVLDSLQGVIAPFVKEHIDRWGNSDHRWSMPKSVDEWNTNVNYMRRFANERESYLNEHFKTVFSLEDLYSIQFGVTDTSMGYIRVNDLDVFSTTPGLSAYQYPSLHEMEYFRQIPVKVSAIAKEGYQFSHWLNLDVTSNTQIVSNQSVPLVAVFEPNTSVSVEEEPELNFSTELAQNYPNPFNPSTNINFTLGSNESQVSLVVYSSLGRLVQTVYSGSLQSGSHQYTVDMSNYPSGIYFYQLSTTRSKSTKAMILMK
jgi:hypothetical protein